MLPGTRAAGAYGVDLVTERHRHRWEFNNAYRTAFEEAGLIASGLAPDGSLVEIAELRDHPFMLGSQFHPELRSRPTAPHPLFREFVRAALGGSRQPAAESREAWEESAVGSRTS